MKNLVGKYFVWKFCIKLRNEYMYNSYPCNENPHCTNVSRSFREENLLYRQQSSFTFLRLFCVFFFKISLVSFNLLRWTVVLNVNCRDLWDYSQHSAANKQKKFIWSSKKIPGYKIEQVLKRFLSGKFAFWFFLWIFVNLVIFEK